MATIWSRFTATYQNGLCIHIIIIIVFIYYFIYLFLICYIYFIDFSHQNMEVYLKKARQF